jgi:hypothetical protein
VKLPVIPTHRPVMVSSAPATEPYAPDEMYLRFV